MPVEEVVTLGRLKCRIVRPLTTPEAVVVFCHGFGAPGTDLVPLADEYMGGNPALEERMLFVFPEAPLALADVPGGRAWWPIDMLELQTAIIEGRFRDLRQMAPPRLPDARAEMLELVESLQTQTGLPLSRFVLGGFSQGAMLTTDLTLHLPQSPAALIVYSGTLLAETVWTQLAPQRAGLRVLQTHGTLDQLLPYEAALWLRDLFIHAGMKVVFQSFTGGHAIPSVAVSRTAELLTELLASPR